MEQLKQLERPTRTGRLDKTIRKMLLKTSPEEAKRTTLYCEYHAEPSYKDGGWCRIHKTTYLVNAITGARIQLDTAYNIPFAPDYKMMGSANAVLNFVLFFPPIPASWTTFHLIEECRDNPFVVKNIERNNKGVYNVTI